MNELINPSVGDTFDEIGESSLMVRNVGTLDKEKLNHYLDAISEFSNFLNVKIQLMKIVSSQLEKLTLIEGELDKKTTQVVSSILHISKGILTGFKKELEVIEGSNIEGLCPEKVSSFRNEVELLEESIDDTEMIFFELRADSEFLALDKIISRF
ncbi:hypothetical protein [uncultured Cyclobacterium sp.]|uniref:hypothetical protein n=1 Tax=uncultured Cyclobacterium sp. TaxID=453820 RepID=UPI0030EEE207